MKKKSETKTETEIKPKTSLTKKKEIKMKANPYFIVIVEWNYPDGDDKEVIDMTFDSLHTAMGFAGNVANSERYNFLDKTKCHPKLRKEQPARKDCGSVTLRSLEKDNTGRWYFAARVFKIEWKEDFPLDF